MNNFVKRTISGVGFVAIMLAAFLTNKYVFGVVMLLSLIVMMKEFLKMTCGKNYWFSQILSILAGATLFSLIYLFKGFNFPGRLVILAFVPVFILMINSLYVKDKSRFDKFSNLYTALIYIAVPWSLLNFAVFNGCGEFNGMLLLCFYNTYKLFSNEQCIICISIISKLRICRPFSNSEILTLCWSCSFRITDLTCICFPTTFTKLLIN